MSERKCRVCGCTDERACETPAGPCFWVEPDLCSGCLMSARLSDVVATRLAAIPGAGLDTACFIYALGCAFWEGVRASMEAAQQEEAAEIEHYAQQTSNLILPPGFEP